MSLVVDVHTHMLSEQWLAMLVEHGAPLYRLVPRGDRKTLFMGQSAIMTPNQGMFDYEMRIAAMDDAGVDIAIISLTCPNVYWGGPEISTRAAVQINDDMAHAQKTYPKRIRCRGNTRTALWPNCSGRATAARWALWCWPISTASR